MMAPVVITILVATVALAMGVWALGWGIQPRYPDGWRVDAQRDGYRIVLVLSGPITTVPYAPADIAAACCLSAAVTGELWDAGHVARTSLSGALRSRSARAHLDGMCFQIVPDAEYESRWRGAYKALGLKTVATLGQVKQSIGSGPPLALIRESMIPHIMDRGSPAVHETCHALRSWDPWHEDPNVWDSGPDAALSLERQAYERFKQRRSNWISVVKN